MLIFHILMRVGVNHMKEQTVAIHAGYNKDGQSTIGSPDISIYSI